MANEQKKPLETSLEIRSAGSQQTVLRVGLWNGAQTCERGRLLYSALIQSAISRGMIGGIALTGVEGSRANGAFRTVESEVSSNELPVWLEFFAPWGRMSSWVPQVVQQVAEHGIVVMEDVVRYGRTGAARAVVPDTANVGQMGSGGNRELQSAEKSPGGVGFLDGMEIQIYAREDTQVNGKPIYQAVAEYLRHQDVEWMSTCRGAMGFGADRRVEKPSWFGRTKAPIVMHIVDEERKLEACIPALVKLVGDEALVVGHKVRILASGSNPGSPQ